MFKIRLIKETSFFFFFLKYKTYVRIQIYIYIFIFGYDLRDEDDEYWVIKGVIRESFGI